MSFRATKNQATASRPKVSSSTRPRSRHSTARSASPPMLRSKAGVVGMALPAARELARFGIRVLTIAPGIFLTPMLRSSRRGALESLGRSVPFPPRLGEPEEFAKLALHMIDNDMLNGEVVRIDGSIRMAGEINHGQGNHQLRDHGVDPHADDVAASAGHAGGDRGERLGSDGGWGGDRPSPRPQSRGWPTRPEFRRRSSRSSR